MKTNIFSKRRFIFVAIFVYVFLSISFAYAQSPHVFIMEDDGLLRDTRGSTKNEEITKRVINKSGDIYDFIVIYTTFQNPYSVSKTAYHTIIKNETRGLGSNIPISDHSLAYGSKGRLKGVTIIHGIDAYYKFDTKSIGPINHEISHQWLVGPDESALDKTQHVTNSPDYEHWSAFLDTATRKKTKTYISPMGGRSWKDNGDGTFSLDYARVPTSPPFSWEAFHDIDLYFMGFISPKKVRPTFLIVTDSLYNDTIRGVKKEITIQDIIQRAGEPRHPTYQKAQRNFTVAFVLLTEKGQPATPAQIEHMDWISRHSPKEWKKATRGLSTMNVGKVAR